MRVRIAYTIEASSWYRRAIRWHYGQTGLATRAEVKRWQESYGSSLDDDISHALQQAIEHGDVDDQLPWPNMVRFPAKTPQTL